MTEKINREIVEKTAHLARLELSDDEIDQFTEQFGTIIACFEELDKLDTDDVEAMSHCLPVTNRFRDDTVAPSLPPELAVANAPESDDEYFKVPRILDSGGGV